MHLAALPQPNQLAKLVFVKIGKNGVKGWLGHSALRGRDERYKGKGWSWISGKAEDGGGVYDPAA